MNKRTIFVAALLPLIIGIVCAEGKVDTRNVPQPDVSYAFGLALGNDLKETGLVIDYDHFMEGFRASMEGWDTKLTLPEAMELIQSTFLEMRQNALMAEFAENLEKGREFLRQNAEQANVRVTESGLQYVVVQEGDGEKPVESDTVRVHYEGRLIDGTVFESSRENGSPVEFPLDGSILGWAEGITLMNVGSRYQLFIPYELAYGEWGYDNIIPPYSVLIFDVELLDIVHYDESADDAAVPDSEELTVEPSFIEEDEPPLTDEYLTIEPSLTEDDIAVEPSLTEDDIAVESSLTEDDVTVEPSLTDDDVTGEPSLTDDDVTGEPSLTDDDVTVEPAFIEEDFALEPTLTDEGESVDGGTEEIPTE